MCSLLEKIYQKKNDLSNHNSEHCFNYKTAECPKVKHFKCLMCRQDFGTKKHINEYYQKYHRIILYEQLQFQNFKEFDVEQKSYFQFSKAMWWKTKTCTVTKYICHRSGKKSLKSVTKIIPKQKKLSNICPTFLTLKKFNSSGLYSVLYQKTHLGHECDKRDLPHRSINANEKLVIANKLSLGVLLNVLVGQYASTQ